MLKKEKADFIAKILLLVLISLISIGILAPLSQNNAVTKDTISCLEEDKSMLNGISAATLGLSFVITFFPDDVGTPIANTLADMNMFFIFVMVVIIVERILVMTGTKMVFLYLVPVICGIFLLAHVTSKEFFEKIAIKLSILAIALVIVIPVATHFTRFVGGDYLNYVNETIEETEKGTKIISDVEGSDGEDKTFLEKVEASFDSIVNSASGSVGFIKNETSKLGNSIAILVVTTFVVPLLVLLFFRWLLNELFSIRLHIPELKKRKNKEPKTEG